MPLVQPRVQQPQALDMVDDDDRAAVVRGQRVERVSSIADWLFQRLIERVQEAALAYVP